MDSSKNVKDQFGKTVSHEKSSKVINEEENHISIHISSPNIYRQQIEIANTVQSQASKQVKSFQQGIQVLSRIKENYNAPMLSLKLYPNPQVKQEEFSKGFPAVKQELLHNNNAWVPGSK